MSSTHTDGSIQPERLGHTFGYSDSVSSMKKARGSSGLSQPRGFTPNGCAKFVLKISGSHNTSRTYRFPRKQHVVVSTVKMGKPFDTPSISKTVLS